MGRGRDGLLRGAGPADGTVSWFRRRVKERRKVVAVRFKRVQQNVFTAQLLFDDKSEEYVEGGQGFFMQVNDILTVGYRKEQDSDEQDT